jgi:molecular chaperone HscC
LEIFDGIIEVSSSTGDNRLGGEDFNEVLIELIKRDLESKLGDEQNFDRDLMEKIRGQAEKARRALSSQPEAQILFTWQGKAYETTITQDRFEAAAEALIARLKDPIVRALRDAKVSANDLSEVILIGGSTRMPIVRKAATTMFGRFPNHSVNPDEAVALGAAVQAGLKARDAALGEVVVTDVCPFSLGVRSGSYENGKLIEDGLFSPIIERNMTIPTSRVQSYWTVDDFQDRILFAIFQGEARLTEDNFKLGEITVPVPKQKGMQRADVRFTYDINGLLEVDVHVPASDERFELLINDEDYAADDLEKRRAELKKLKVHPRDMEFSKALLARANRCWENALGEERDYIGHIVRDFEKVLKKQDPKAAVEAGKILKEHLDHIDGVTFL